MESCVSDLSGVLVHRPRCGLASSSLVSLGHSSRRHVGRVLTKCAVSRLRWQHGGPKMWRRRRKSKMRWSDPGKRRKRHEALKALGEMQGPEVEFLQDALKRARHQPRNVHLPPKCPSAEGSSSVQNVDWRDPCRTRSRVGSAQRGTQSSDPSRSPSRGVASRHPSTTCSGCLRRVGRSEGAPHLQFPIRSCLPIYHRGWTIGPHPEAHFHDGRVRPTRHRGSIGT